MVKPLEMLGGKWSSRNFWREKKLVLFVYVMVRLLFHLRHLKTIKEGMKET